MDIELAQEAKPEPDVAIVSDPVARAAYRAEVENWGDRVHDASVRLCNWFNQRGGDFACGETSFERSARISGGR